MDNDNLINYIIKSLVLSKLSKTKMTIPTTYTNTSFSNRYMNINLKKKLFYIKLEKYINIDTIEDDYSKFNINNL